MALLQNQSIGNSATTTFNLTVTSTTAGSCGVVFLMWKSSVTALAATPITDNKSGGSQTYTQAGSTKIFGATSHYSIAAFVCPNNAAGVTQITANFATTGAPAIMWYVEESGIVTSNPLDSTATPVSATFTATPWSSGNMAASTAANLVLYGFSCVDTTASAGYAASGSWSAVGTHTPETSDGDDSFLERQVVSATGTYAATGTMTANQTGVAYVLALVQASGITLTGQAITSGKGSLGVTNNPALTGQAVTSSKGSLTPQTYIGLTGQAITSSEGTLAPQLVVTLTGRSVTSGLGSLTPNLTIAVPGIGISSAHGALVASTSLALVGRSIASSLGALAPQLGVSLTGLSITSHFGTVTVYVPPVAAGGGIAMILARTHGARIQTDARASAVQVGAVRAGRVQIERVSDARITVSITQSRLIARTSH